MMDFLEFADIQQEIRGAMILGRLKLTDQTIIFKNSRTGKVEQIASDDIELINWQRLAGSWGLRIFKRDGNLFRYGGFKESDHDRLSKFFLQTYKKELCNKELSVKGWNWGTTVFNGQVLSFNVCDKTAFEVPLYNASQCVTGKNEVTLEFHQNDDAPISLMEMRFHIPPSCDDTEPVDIFYDEVMKQASVITATGDAIAIFRELQCLTPRGRYDIKIYQTFIQLHGKTFDYKIPMSTVLRLFLLPHKDGRQMFFVVSLDPPIKQGQTRYHFLILLFSQEEETSVEIPLSENVLKEKYDDRLEKIISGPTYEVLSKIMKATVNRKITIPGNFKGHSGTPAVSCSYKAAAGYLYPLERGFIYVHKPPVYIRFEEIEYINFARGGTNTRSFDIEVQLRQGIVHSFISIEKEEYSRLYAFVTNKHLKIKNRSRLGQDYVDDLVDSDAEDHDPYLDRVKAEGEEKNSEESEDESEDEDFKPPDEEGSEGAEEYDSNVSTSSSEDEVPDTKKKKDDEKEKKIKTPKQKMSIDKSRKSRSKKEQDKNAPKRPPTAYFMWFAEARKKIVETNPGCSITEIGKKGGEIWRSMDAGEKKIYEDRALVAKKEYQEKLLQYKAEEKEKLSATTKNKTPTKTSPSKLHTGGFKSKEYFSTSDESDDDKSNDGKDTLGAIVSSKEIGKECEESNDTPSS